MSLIIIGAIILFVILHPIIRLIAILHYEEKTSQNDNENA